MSRHKVVLTATEMMIAAYVGSGRHVQAIARGWKHLANAPPDNVWNTNIEGGAGEMAVAKFLNLYWLPVIGDNQADDVGPYQVRTNSSRKHSDLCLRPKDRADRCYISVLSFAPEFLVLGWITGADGKSEQWLRDGAPNWPQCYYVPEAALHAMELLPKRGIEP